MATERRDPRGSELGSATAAGASPPPPGDPDPDTRGVTDKARDKAGQVVDKVGERAGPVVEQAQEKVGQAADQARQQATSRLEGQKERAAEGMGGLAQAIRKTGQQLREEDQQPLARYADMTAEQIERFSGYLRGRDVDELVREAEGYARRQPTLFLGGAFGLGLLAARFLRSSGRRASAASRPSSRLDTGAPAVTGTFTPPPAGGRPPGLGTPPSPTLGRPPASPPATSGSGLPARASTPTVPRTETAAPSPTSPGAPSGSSASPSGPAGARASESAGASGTTPKAELDTMAVTRKPSSEGSPSAGAQPRAGSSGKETP